MHIVICGSNRCDLFLFLLVVLCDRLFLAMVDMIVHARWSQDGFMIVILWSCFHGRITTCLYRSVSAIGANSDRKSMEHAKINLVDRIGVAIGKGLMWLIQCDFHGRNNRLDLHYPKIFAYRSCHPCDPAPLTGERNRRAGPWNMVLATALLVRVATPVN